ncbi:MAG: hypothetical protein K6E85_08455 [Lachnospiraceae bacterium]|nr:hypothetical protein [Lachnospiraceae bacterium]
MAKFSKYNICVSNPDGGYILYNPLTNNIILLTDEDYAWMESVDLEKVDKTDESYNHIITDRADELIDKLAGHLSEYQRIP